MSGQKNNEPEEQLEARRKYVAAFNDTMVRIWKERMALLGTVDTGALYRSAVGIRTDADGKCVQVTLSQAFNLYGLFVDYGTGRETPRGNPGDIGRDKVRRPKPWFSRKYFASVMNIREFFADNLGEQSANIISNALGKDAARRFIT